MNKRHSAVVLALACQMLMGSFAFAQEVPAEPEKLWSVRSGLGFTVDPDSFLINFEVERFMRKEVAVGFAIQLGADDDYVLVSPHLFARYVFDLSRASSEFARKAQPYAQGGLGLTHLAVDSSLKVGGSDKSETDFMMNFGIGVDYPLNRSITIGTRMLINIVPADVLDERIFFSWEILSIRYRW